MVRLLQHSDTLGQQPPMNLSPLAPSGLLHCSPPLMDILHHILLGGPIISDGSLQYKGNALHYGPPPFRNAVPSFTYILCRLLLHDSFLPSCFFRLSKGPSSLKPHRRNGPSS